MIETFEIHITGDKSILTAAKPLKTIEVNLLKPDRSILRTEYMTSHVQYMASGFAGCKKYVDDIVKCLEFQGVNIIRVKIESPFYKHYVEQSLYIESHFENEDFKLPTSQNARHTMPVVTAREYEQRWFEPFMEHYSPSRTESIIELCLFDTDVDEDKDWFDLY